MSDALFRATPSVRHPWPLVARGGLARTFGSLAVFLALLFLCAGIYLLQQALEVPLETGDAAVITAGVAIALALVLLFFLLRQLTTSLANSRKTHRKRFRRVRAMETPGTAAASRDGHRRGNLAYQRFYVDRYLIRP